MTIPTTREGQLLLATQIVNGDTIAEANVEPLLTNPDRATVEAARLSMEQKLNQRADLEAQTKAITDSIQAESTEFRAILRNAVRYVKAVYNNQPAIWNRYGISDFQATGSPPEAPISIIACNETESSIEIVITGGKNASRFMLWRRLETESLGQAIPIATDIRPKDRAYTDTTLVAGARYIFHVTAHNSYGSAGPSNEVRVTP